MTKIKADRKAIADVFVKVLAVLPDVTHGQESPYASPYICDQVWNMGVRSDKLADKIRTIIRERLNNKFSIEDWLKSQSDVIAEQVRHDVMFNKGRKLQEYRKAWVRELIKEFSA